MLLQYMNAWGATAVIALESPSETKLEHLKNAFLSTVLTLFNEKSMLPVNRMEDGVFVLDNDIAFRLYSGASMDANVYGKTLP
jgi:hypothetical protein